ncbi:MAG: endo-1,4-beta-xylanase [Cytophagales bacterium]
MRLLIILFFLIHNIYSQPFDKSKSLKDYSGKTVITSQVRSEGNKAILRGTESKKNKEFVISNYNGIQMSVYPAWDFGFWPKQKPNSIEDFDYNVDGLSELVNWGIENNMYLIHHCLFFPNKYFPNWFWESNYNSNELDEILNSYIEKVLITNKNGAKIDALNVINEIFDKNGNYRPSGYGNEDVKWMDIGYEDDNSHLNGDLKINDKHPIFVRKVLQKTRSLSNAKLEIRDFNIAFGGKKADGLYQLVKHLKNSNVPIDAIGFQCHLNTNINYNYDDMYDNIKRFQEIGVEIYITELDVGMNLWGGDGKPRRKVSDVIKNDSDWDDYFDKQNKIYYNIIKTSREAGVKLISDWGFRDDVPYGNWRKDQKAWMVNKDYSKKQAYYEVLRALYETQEK